MHLFREEILSESYFILKPNLERFKKLLYIKYFRVQYLQSEYDGEKKEQVP